MDVKTYYRKKVFPYSNLSNDAMLQVAIDMPEECGRETGHLIEEKMDNFFDEVKTILLNASDRIV